MSQVFVCTECSEEYAAPGFCQMCQVELIEADDESLDEYGLHDVDGEDEDDDEEKDDDEEGFDTFDENEVEKTDDTDLDEEE